MKKTYETPSIEVVAFQYRDQVVAASGGGCIVSHQATAIETCGTGTTYTREVGQ